MISRSTAFSGTFCVTYWKTCWKIADFLGEIPTDFCKSEMKKTRPSSDFCESDVQSGQTNGTPGGIRTHGLPLRRRPLYPTELRVHGLDFQGFQRFSSARLCKHFQHFLAGCPHWIGQFPEILRTCLCKFGRFSLHIPPPDNFRFPPKGFSRSIS